MSKKLVVKLLATVMAMTMVVGSELTVFAAEPDLHGVTHVGNEYCSDPNNSLYPSEYDTCFQDGTTQHYYKCNLCGAESSHVECGTDGTKMEYQDQSKHNVCCKQCGRVLGEANHVEAPNASYVEDTGHAKYCEACEHYIGELEAHTYKMCYFSINGVPKHGDSCIVCNFYKEDTLADHDTNGENGACSVCGYNPNLIYGDPLSNSVVEVTEERKSSSTSSSSSKKEKDEKIKETSVSSSTPKVDIVEEINKALAKQLEETIKAEESIPVTSFASTTAVNAVPAEVKATATAGATYNLSQITTTQGFVAAVNKIAEANPGATSVTVYSSNPMAFSEDVLTAVANANKEFVYTFNHKGHLYKITIPAGAKIDLNGNRYAGPLYIGAQLGTSVVLK